MSDWNSVRVPLGRGHRLNSKPPVLPTFGRPQRSSPAAAPQPHWGQPHSRRRRVSIQGAYAFGVLCGVLFTLLIIS